MIVKSVVLHCSPERAFSLFTEHAGAWWPLERRHTPDAASEIRFERLGRFFERASDGTEVELGIVRAFEPARRLMLEWYPGSGPAHPTQVEVTFEAVESGTRVTVAHSLGRASADLFDRNAPTYAQAWDQLLRSLVDRATLRA